MFSKPRLARDRLSPPGFIAPCRPTLAAVAPSGPAWLHEMKHDGYRILPRKEPGSLRLWSRQGRSWHRTFERIAEAVASLPVPVVMDGEAVAHCEEGLPAFDRLTSRLGGRDARLYAFDVLMIDGEDLRRLPLDERRARLAELLRLAPDGLHLSEEIPGDGPTVFEHACRLGLEGIISKRRDRPYKSGPCQHWRKIKNPSYQRGR
jgi:bifunctional non-homologous end joining protein LigD